MKARILLIMRYGNAKVVSEFLENEGYQVFFMQDGEKFVQIVNEGNFDVVIVDISEMPKSAWDIIMELKEQNTRFIVINRSTKILTYPLWQFANHYPK